MCVHLTCTTTTGSRYTFVVPYLRSRPKCESHLGHTETFLVFNKKIPCNGMRPVPLLPTKDRFLRIWYNVVCVKELRAVFNAPSSLLLKDIACARTI